VKQKEEEMQLFLDIHKLDASDADVFLAAWSRRAGDDMRCLKHWLKEDAIALLVEAPDEEYLRAKDPDAIELTELFAPASRWAAEDEIDIVGARPIETDERR
jgi:hypothetical protein